MWLVVEQPYLAGGIAADRVDVLAAIALQGRRDGAWGLPAAVVDRVEGEFNAAGVAHIQAPVAPIAVAPVAHRHGVIGVEDGGAPKGDRNVDQWGAVGVVEIVIGHKTTKINRHLRRRAVLEAVGCATGVQIGKSRREFSPASAPFRYIIVLGI